jgi:hypothetical protein
LIWNNPTFSIQDYPELSIEPRVNELLALVICEQLCETASKKAAEAETSANAAEEAKIRYEHLCETASKKAAEAKASANAANEAKILHAMLLVEYSPSDEDEDEDEEEEEEA